MVCDEDEGRHGQYALTWSFSEGGDQTGLYLKVMFEVCFKSLSLSLYVCMYTIINRYQPFDDNKHL